MSHSALRVRLGVGDAVGGACEIPLRGGGLLEDQRVPGLHLGRFGNDPVRSDQSQFEGFRLGCGLVDVHTQDAEGFGFPDQPGAELLDGVPNFNVVEGGEVGGELDNLRRKISGFRLCEPQRDEEVAERGGGFQGGGG